MKTGSLNPERSGLHLDIVRCCPCAICAGAHFHYDNPVALIHLLKPRDRIRRSDPHHTPSDAGQRRRTSDQSVVPLCRRHHNWMDTVEGKRWERENLYPLRRIALEIGVWSGITVGIERARFASESEFRMADYLVE